MSRTASKPHFYEIGQAQDSPGKWSRRHILRCSKCDASIGYKALTDEKIRKRAINLGWDVGKTQTQHLCPKHAHAQKSYAQPQPIIEVHDVVTPLPRITLREAWEQASEGERQELIKHLQDGEVLMRVKFPTTDKPPENKFPISVIDEPEERAEPDPGDIEVADIIFGKRKSA